MKSSTLAGFTSGVVSIAATIMVLQLTTPLTGDASALFEQWATFLAHYNSFFLIYVLWYNHAKEFSRVETINSDLVIFNALWLIFLALIPFATSWVEHFPNHRAPELTFSILLLICILISGAMNKRLYKEYPDIVFSTRATFWERFPIYLGLIVAIVNAFIVPFFNLFIFFAITVYMTVLIVHTRHRDITIL